MAWWGSSPLNASWVWIFFCSHKKNAKFDCPLRFLSGKYKGQSSNVVLMKFLGDTGSKAINEEQDEVSLSRGCHCFPIPLLCFCRTMHIVGQFPSSGNSQTTQSWKFRLPGFFFFPPSWSFLRTRTNFVQYLTPSQPKQICVMLVSPPIERLSWNILRTPFGLSFLFAQPTDRTSFFGRTRQRDRERESV